MTTALQYFLCGAYAHTYTLVISLLTFRAGEADLEELKAIFKTKSHVFQYFVDIRQQPIIENDDVRLARMTEQAKAAGLLK